MPDPAATPTPPTGEPLATQPPAGGSSAAPAAPPVPAPTEGSVAPPAGAAVDPAERIKALEHQLTETRREAAGYRTQNKGELAEFKKAMAAALGLEAATAPPDAASLLAQFQERDAKRDQEVRRMKIDLALTDVYSKVGVIPKLTRAVLESEGLLSDLNPDDAEFGKTLTAAVKRMADEVPQIKAGQVPATPPRSSGAFPGGNNNATPQLTLEEVRAMKPEEVNAAREKGQLNQLLGRKA